MKKLLIPLVLMLLFSCGCSDKASDAASTAGEQLLQTIVEKVDVDELKNYAEKGADALAEKFPALKPLTSRQDMQEFLKDKGIDLIQKYLESTDAEVQANAEKLGAIIKILSPELTDEIDAILPDEG